MSGQKKTAMIGAWCTVGHPLVVEAMLSTGVYDWLTVDLEHCAFSEPELVQVFMVCERYNVVPYARIAGHDPLQARKVLDLGAKGLLVPVVDTVEQAKKIIDILHFGPTGRRGVCLARINHWGDDFNDYIRAAKPKLVLQIETQRAIENLDALAQLDGVDGLFLGPYDLSASFGQPGDFASARFVKAVSDFQDGCRKHGRWAGIHVVEPEPAKVNERVAQGFDFIAYGTDLICLRSSLQSLARERGVSNKGVRK